MGIDRIADLREIKRLPGMVAITLSYRERELVLEVIARAAKHDSPVVEVVF